MAYNYRQINYSVMIDTKNRYETNPVLMAAVKNSIQNQFVVYQEDDVEVPQPGEGLRHSEMSL